MTDNPSNNDQNDPPEPASETEGGGALDRKTVVASAVLLLGPALIPLFFMGSAEGTTNLAVLGATSLIVLLLNAVLLLVLSRWFKKMRES